jgi:hypothetical protein
MGRKKAIDDNNPIAPKQNRMKIFVQWKRFFPPSWTSRRFKILEPIMKWKKQFKKNLCPMKDSLDLGF